MKNWMLVWAVAVILVLPAFVVQKAQADGGLLAQEESPAEESPVSGTVEFIGSRDSGVWVYAERKVTEKFALSISATKYQKGFQEEVFGLTYYLKPGMQVGVGLGAAQYVSSDKSRLVISAFGYMETDNLKAEVLFEKYGRDPQPYYRFYAQTPLVTLISEKFREKLVTLISEKLEVGVYGEQGVGWGPRISWSVSKNVNLWLSPLAFEQKDGNMLVGGLQFTF
jgi:hypothetical protein